LDPYRKNGSRSFDEANDSSKPRIYTLITKAGLGRHIRLGRLFADSILEAAAKPENGYWRIIRAVSLAVLIQIRFNVSQF